MTNPFEELAEEETKQQLEIFKNQIIPEPPKIRKIRIKPIILNQIIEYENEKTSIIRIANDMLPQDYRLNIYDAVIRVVKRRVPTILTRVCDDCNKTFTTNNSLKIRCSECRDKRKIKIPKIKQTFIAICQMEGCTNEYVTLSYNRKYCDNCRKVINSKIK